jgi:opacity protein-like surface antigen
MRKLFLGLGIVISGFAFSQQFGLKAGLNVSDINNGASGTDMKAKTGLYVGVTAKIPVSDEFSVQPELIYNQLGAKTNLYDFGGIIGNVSTTTKLDYISLPVMLQYNFPSNFYLELGPEFSYMVSAKQGLSTSIISPSTDINMDYLNRLNVGAGFGAGYNLNKNIGISARYTLGLTGLGKNGNVTDYFLDSAKNNNLQVGVNFKF